MALIHCAGKKKETVEHLDLGDTGILVTEYLTELTPRELLAWQLHAAIARARQQLIVSHTALAHKPRKQAAT